jgi:integrase
VPGECISQGAIQKYLTACGYDEHQHKPHGFRSSFTTLATEAGQEGAIIELCLAHADSNKVRAAYNRAARMDARRALMQWYSDYIEELKAKA